MTSAKISAKQKEVQRILDTISRAIAQHRLPPGTRLVEAQIVESLNANRNHVQAALQRLALKRIVTIEPNRGAMVSQPTAVEAREVFQARRAIERAIIENITPEKMATFSEKLEQHMASEGKATQGNDPEASLRELSAFHGLLSEVSGNAVLAEMLDNLMVRSSLIVALYQRNDVPACQHQEHTGIIRALEQGDHETAIRLMQEHLLHIESELILEGDGKSPVDLKEALTGI